MAARSLHLYITGAFEGANEKRCGAVHAGRGYRLYPAVFSLPRFARQRLQILPNRQPRIAGEDLA